LDLATLNISDIKIAAAVYSHWRWITDCTIC